MENAIAAKATEKKLRSKKQPLSGVLKGFPNDVQVENILVEAKVRSTHLDSRGRKCITLQLDWLDGVQKNALREGFVQGIVVARPKGAHKLLALMDFDWFLELLAEIHAERLDNTHESG